MGNSGDPNEPDFQCFWREEVVAHYLEDSGDGHYFAALANARDAAVGLATNQVAGVALTRDEETKTCQVDAMINDENDPRLNDGLYYLWLSRVIHRFSFNVMLPTGFSAGLQTSSIAFPEIRDAATERLLGTFGYEADGTWLIPFPRVTIAANRATIDDMLKHNPPPPDRSVALVAEGDPSTTHFFEAGEKIGELTYRGDPDSERLVDDSGTELQIVTPLHNQSYDMRESFGSPVVRRQLGYVTLLRVRAAAV